MYKIHLVSIRYYCTSLPIKPIKQTPKRYEDIPGPKGPFGIGNFIKYLPLIGDYSLYEMHKMGYDKYKRYGPIVREIFLPGEHIVWLYKSEDISVLLNSKNHPLRKNHVALKHYRNKRPHVYRTAGLLATNGPDWWHLRSEFQKEISSPKVVRYFLSDVDQITKEFISNFLPKNHAFNFLPRLERLNLELTCFITFGQRLNSFNQSEEHIESLSSRLIQSAATTNNAILFTDQGFKLWQYFETPIYRRLRKSQEFMESVAIDLVKRCITNDTNDPLLRSSLVYKYSMNPNLDLKDVIGMAADLLLAGIDTTSYSMAFALYHIATNPDIQYKLYEEAVSVIPKKDAPLIADILTNQIPYTRAILKEVFRLNPISIGLSRLLNEDTIFSGYLVPKGTMVVTQNMVASRLEINFPNALKFQPERWLNEQRNSIKPFLVLPFGHGMRACIARRLAEQNIFTLLLRLLRQYELVWCGDDSYMDIKTVLINKPSQPIYIQLKERDS